MMNKKIFCGALVVVFAITMTNVSIPVQSKSVAPSEQKTKQQKVKIEFNTPLSTAKLVSVVKKFKLEPTELYYAQDDIQGGYSISEGESIEIAVEKMLDAHNQFLEDAIAQSSEAMNKSTDEPTFEMLSVLNDQFVVALNKIENNKFTISGMQVNKNKNVNKMQKVGLISNITLVTQRQKVKLDVFNTQEQVDSISTKSLSHESWAPYGGTSKVNQRYTLQTFYFNNTSDFGSTSTYEHETQVYNKSFADYNGYWSSNLPRAYKDTPFLDSIDNFTVGSAKASSIRTNYRYYTYMTLRAGSASSATVRIKGQKGHRWPSWCYSTWCIFPDATTGSMATFTAPAGISWQY